MRRHRRIVGATFGTVRGNPVRRLDRAGQVLGDNTAMTCVTPQLESLRLSLQSLQAHLTRRVSSSRVLKRAALRRTLCRICDRAVRHSFPNFRDLGMGSITFSPVTRIKLSPQSHRSLYHFLRRTLYGINGRTVTPAQLAIVYQDYSHAGRVHIRSGNRSPRTTKSTPRTCSPPVSKN